MSLGAALVVALINAVLGTIRDNAKEQADIKHSVANTDAKVDKLAMVICLQNDASALRCRQYGLMQ